MWCEKSLIPASSVPNAEVKPVDYKLYAANNTEIAILGSLRLGFTVQGIPLCADLLVSDEVEEIMLGVDWLTENHCKWHFVERQVEIKGRMIPLRNRRSLAGVRRVRVAENVCVPPGTQVNVPVKLTRNSLRTPKADWLVESKRWCPGIFSTRTLLPDNAEFIAVRLVNTSSLPFRLAGGQLIGEARTVIFPDSGPLRADGVRPEHPQAQTGSDRIGPDQVGSSRGRPDGTGSCRCVRGTGG